MFAHDFYVNFALISAYKAKVYADITQVIVA
jgi:hypothetical protein